ncbi:MAG: SDR family oxidoreductase [Promethearchaeota archaeon]|nr:MAG: SDR family oxidoreductase [Candidatus Lokiarchaeota archaeon]
MENDLSDNIVLLTGVGGGIGNAFVHALVGRVKVLITSSRSEESEVLNSSDSPENFTHLSYDLTREQNVQALMDHIRRDYGKLDILINTIGGSLYSFPLEEYPLEAFHEVFRVNLDSAFLLTKESVRLMKDSGGNIVHIVSSSADNIAKKKAPYGMAKAALGKLIQYAAAELASYNIRVNGISPTYVFTPRHEREIQQKAKREDKSEEQIRKDLMKTQLIKRPLHSEDLIPLMELLATTKVITGQVYRCTLGEVLK